MDNESKWVVVWAVPKEELEMPCWLMVRHKERGWELPGGSIMDNETYDIAALRELFEESGLLGIATNFETNLLKDGVVVRVVIDEEPQPYGWDSNDEQILEVGWCIDIPGELYWGEGEIQKIINHDWSASSSLSS